MRKAKILMPMAIVIIAVILSTAATSAWFWPIFGFGPGPCPPQSYDIAPSPILPGTFEWATMSPGPAHLVVPGYAYGLSGFLNNQIRFGPVPVFGVPPQSAPGNVTQGNETAGNKTIGNTTIASQLLR